MNTELIKFLRVSHGYSQDEISRKLGLCQATYSRIEKGQQKRIDPEIVDKLAMVYGVPKEKIVGYQYELSFLPEHLRNFVTDEKNVRFIEKAYYQAKFL